jgi:transposase
LLREFGRTIPVDLEPHPPPFASYLGLTPRERSSGLIRRLGANSKRGDVYLRMLLTHGARAVLWKAKSRRHPDRLRGHHKAALALANKMARIV